MYLICFHIRGKGILNKHTRNTQGLVPGDIHHVGLSPPMPQDRILPKKEQLALLPPTAEAVTPLSDHIVVGKSFASHSGPSKTKEKGPWPLQVSGDTCKNNTGCIENYVVSCYIYIYETTETK